MTDRPILFSAPMVKALLEGRKTQMRRAIRSARVFSTPEAPAWTLKGDDLDRAFQGADRFRHLGHNDWCWEADAFEWQAPATRTQWLAHIGFAPGDRLWVREAWRVSRKWDQTAPRDLPPRMMTVFYDAGGSIANQASGKWEPDNDYPPSRPDWVGRLRAGMFLPRWASRLTLIVTDVRVQRLHDISEADALAEGVIWQNVIVDTHGATGRHVEVTADCYWNGTEPHYFEGRECAVDAYADLWERINGPGSWDENPWVAAYTFTVHQQNIDEVQAHV